MIKRVSVTYDIAHGGTFNSCFSDKGITFYKQGGSIHGCDSIVNSECFTFDSTLNTMDVPYANVHCDLTVDGNVLVCGCSTLNGAVCVDSTLNVTSSVCLCDGLDVDCNGSFHSDILVDGNACVCNDLTVDNATTLCSDTTINGPAIINNTLNVNGTTTIAGDLYVSGTSYEEHSTDLYVGSDFVTLRDGSETGLDEGEKAGIIINKYDGTDSLGIITDTTGTLRIGEFNTVKVYTTDDATYYLDRELTQETTIPTDEDGNRYPLYRIGETDPETGLSEFYYIDKDDTEALATRSGDMCRNAYVWWNGTLCQLEANPEPDKDYHNIPFYNAHNCTNDLAPLTPENGIVITTCDGIYNLATCSNSVVITDSDGGAASLESNVTGGILTTGNTSTPSPQWLSPGCNNQVLSICTVQSVEGVVTQNLCWKTVPAICHYASTSCYEADKANVPVGSVVVIDDVTNYVVSEQV